MILGLCVRLPGALFVVFALLASLTVYALGLEIALTLAPAALMALPLLLGRFPGEQVIARLRRGPNRRRVRAVSTTWFERRPEATFARGGRLVACCLAGRAPPQFSLR